ncbi:acetylornithine deacetylase [Paroceanicella profunda]|uniref:Acetylornithine deacetylase n=1 Tax=Paroceanicella profunda TaxID=2579971 RepID=A0A5B8FYY6_9RHOB|nr:acetylornithine deacetylase [Paroceanicella profunda]
MLDDTTAILADLIAFPTVSSQSNLELIAYAADRLGQCGASLSLTLDAAGQKANLFATLGPEQDGGVMLSGHTDVVPVTDQDWRTDPFALHAEDGLLYGRGACDMKGFLAATLAFAATLEGRRLSRPLHFAFTYDEEVGCLGGRALVEQMRDMAFRPSVAIVGEPTEMGIIEGHKGCCEYTTVFTGLEGHGSRPDRGVNAAEYAVRYVTRLMELREDLRARCPADSRFEPPWTTLQIGRIAGGHAHNVIPGQCEVDWELRPVTPADGPFLRAAIDDWAAAELLPEMRALCPSADIVRHVVGEIVGLTPVPDNAARRIVSELTGANGADVVAFGTEAGLFQGLGIDVVVCGPGSIAQAHKPDEYVSVEQMSRCLDMLGGLGRTLTA